jgi:DNA polymerase-3 subunit alpha
MFQSDNDVERYWVNYCWDKLQDYCKKKNKDIIPYIDELEEEAEVKTIVGQRLDTNMFSYPVVLQHYIDLIWECGSIIGAGRGSACSALNHLLLGITQLDPLEWSMPFFRYMNRDTTGLGKQYCSDVNK